MPHRNSELPWYLRDLDPSVYLNTSTHLTLDFETTNTEKGSALAKENRIVLACFALGDAPPTLETEGWEALRQAINDARILNCHNAKFELQWLWREGINTDHLLVLDTQVAEYVIAGNRRWPLNLDAVGRRYGLGKKERVIDALMKGGVCPSEMPAHWLQERVISDVLTTRELARKQLSRISDLGQLGTLFTRCITTPVLAAIEMQGMTLDGARVKQAYIDTLYKLAEAERELGEIGGGINLRSPKQLGELLYKTLGFEELKDWRGNPKRTASGKPLTDSESLEALKAKTKQQKRFVKVRKEWGKLNAALTKSLNFFKHVVDEDGGVMYGRYNQTVTQTHRLSSSGRRRVFSDGFEGGCQFQNLPNEFKSLFVAGRGGEKGYGGLLDQSESPFVLVETDGSGIEFRVAGGIASDPQAIWDIANDADIHRYTASIINNKPEDEVTKDERREAKPDTFKPLYGGQSGTPRQVAYYEAFKEKYAKIAELQESWVTEVLNTKQLVLPWGMRFYWPNIRVGSKGQIHERPQIYNYPIQNLATAEIVLIALVYLYWRIKVSGVRARIINTVHDSAIAEVHRDDVAEYREIAIQCFLDDVYTYLDRVYALQWQSPALGVGIVVGTHWGEGPEEKHSKPSPFV